MKYTNIDNANARIKELEKENAKIKQKHENSKHTSELWRKSYFESAAKVRELEEENRRLYLRLQEVSDLLAEMRGR